jgi:putative copper export protein
MSTFLLFLHWVGFSIWLGALLTFMVWVPVSKAVALEPWAHAWKTLAKLQRWVVAPSAVVATLTGFGLTMRLGSRQHDTGLVGMMACGVLAALVALAVVAPLSNRMGWVAEQSLADGEKDPAAERIRVRLAVAGTVTGLFILAAIWFGVMAPPAGGAQ